LHLSQHIPDSIIDLGPCPVQDTERCEEMIGKTKGVIGKTNKKNKEHDALLRHVGARVRRR
jgi:hypothetical protein